MSKPVLSCHQLTKVYIEAKNELQILDKLDFQVLSGEQVAIVGPSGSGKSTLLHLLGGLDKPTSGNVIVMGQNLAGIGEKKRCRLRNKSLGFVYQFHHLLPEFSALENVAMPLLIGDKPIGQAKDAAASMLSLVGLDKRMQHKPAQLSGGERQRVAIARALVTEPECVLADEPTGNLDSHTAEVIYQLMQEINQQLSTSLVIVTHDLTLAAKMDRVMELKDGRLS